MLRLLVILCFACSFFSPNVTFSVQPNQKNLPIGLAEHEKNVRFETPPPLTAPPVGPVRSLGEWEESEAIMTLWTNPSLIREFVKRNQVKLFADSDSEKHWWLNWLTDQGISAANISFLIAPTDSIWIRDYGPWPILDGNGQFAFTHGQYNRPRPQDDKVSDFLANSLNIPIYKHGLVHTGGNYYSDALGNAFSSTLVFSENPNLTPSTIYERMKKFLGIERYATSPLSPGLTIEHLDTFGKLVSADTWVWSEFPTGSPYRADSEKMLTLLKSLKSPYGTPYRIHRMKMRTTPGGSDYRAYINSFISNRAIYFPTYGDANDVLDNDAKLVYQKALPGYEVVGVDGLGTTWGDSVHCRNRNLLKRNALFAFPQISQAVARGRTIATLSVEWVSPDAKPDTKIEVTSGDLYWRMDGVAQTPIPLSQEREHWLTASLPSVPSGKTIELHVELMDQSHLWVKRIPAGAPAQTISFTTN